MKSRNHLNRLSFLLAIPAIIIVAIFISEYCRLFDDLGMAAKKRLLDNPLLTFFVTPLFFWIAAYLCRRFSIEASGIHIEAALKQLEKTPNDFSKVSPLLNLRFVVVKTFSSLIANFGGGSLGREGPSVHMTAALFPVFANRYKNILPKISLESWALSGAAVGLTIVFNAPFAALMFVIERLSAKADWKNCRENILWTLFAVSVCEIFFHKAAPLLTFYDVQFSLGMETILLILMAIVCGGIAFIFKSTAVYFYQKFLNIKSNYWHSVPILAGLLAASISFYCGIYSFSGGIETIKQTLASPEPFLSYKEVFGRIFNTLLTFISGCAGGLIAPSMAIGIGIGSIFSNLAPHFDIGVFLLIAMAAFLSAVIGKPVTAALIIFEATRQNFNTLPFLIIAAAIALGIRLVFEKMEWKRFIS